MWPRFGSVRKSGSPSSRGSEQDKTRGRSKSGSPKVPPAESGKEKWKAVGLINSVERVGSDLYHPPRQTQPTNTPGQHNGMDHEMIFFYCQCLRKKTLPVPQRDPVIRSFEFKGRLITQAGACLTCCHMMEACGGQCVVQKASDPIGPWILGLARRSKTNAKLPLGKHSGWTYDYFRYLNFMCCPGYTFCKCHNAKPLRYLEEGLK